LEFRRSVCVRPVSAETRACGCFVCCNKILANGEVLFNGRDASVNYGLWVTNGTAVGTHELTGISGASPGGLTPSSMVVVNGEVLFKGTDANADARL
jgi:ELWxxDGT repeat protein